VSRPPRTVIATLIVALAVVFASAPGAVATPSGPSEPSESPTTAPNTADHATTDRPQTDRSTTTVPYGENASVAAWRIPHYVDATTANATELASHWTDRDEASHVNVTPGDHLAVAVHVPGLDDAVANRSGTRTERVLDALDGDGRFVVSETKESVGTSQVPTAMWLNASNTRAVAAPGSDRYVLVVDPGAVAAVGPAYYSDEPRYEAAAADDALDGGPGEAWLRHDVFAARLSLNASLDETAASTRSIAFVEPFVDLQAVDGPFEPGSNVTVAGRTPLPSGTTVDVVVETDAGVVASATVPVEDGRFAAEIDLSGASTTESARVRATATDGTGGLVSDEVEFAVRRPDATVSFPDQTSTTQYVNARVNLTHGGVLVLRNDSGVVASSGELAAGTNETVTFTVSETAPNGTYTVVAYRGTPGGRTDPYPDGTATATLRFATDDDDPSSTTTITTATTATTTGTTATTTTRNATTPTTDATTASAPTLRPRSSTTDGPIPGFDVPVALLALIATLAGVHLAGRRREP